MSKIEAIYPQFRVRASISTPPPPRAAYVRALVIHVLSVHCVYVSDLLSDKLRSSFQLDPIKTI